MKRFKVGDRVMFTCSSGSISEEIILSQNELVCLPQQWSFEEGAGFLWGYLTAYNGIKQRGEIKKGDTVLVTGASGGMGMAAVQLSKAFGATVIACGSSSRKLEECKKMGADHVLNYGEDGTKGKLKEEVSKLTKGKNVDLVYDPVGGSIGEEAFRCLGWAGRFLVVGFTSGKPPIIQSNHLLIKQASLVGVLTGMALLRNPKLMLEAINDISNLDKVHSLKPLVHSKHTLDQAANAYRLLKERSVVGKVVITTKQTHSNL